MEVHYRYGLLYNLWKNRKLQKWFESQREYSQVKVSAGEIVVPSAQFNALYLLLHTYRHQFAEGVGLRQIMDYYFFLKTYAGNIDRKTLTEQVKALGMEKFAKALMWVLAAVFDGQVQVKDWMIWEPDETEGRYLLESVMAGGNFGRANKKKEKRSHMRILTDMMKHSLHMSLHYGQEALWAPIWHVYHFFWKRTAGRV